VKLGLRQAQVLRALRARPMGSTADEVADDIQRYQDRACTTEQATSSLESLRVADGERVPMVWLDEHGVYRPTGAGRRLATDL
jgi:hypothetical protein